MVTPAWSAGRSRGRRGSQPRKGPFIQQTLRDAALAKKRVFNLQRERSPVVTLDFATTAEETSFGTEDFRATLVKLRAR